MVDFDRAPRVRKTPASCANRTGGVADWIGVSMTIVPTYLLAVIAGDPRG